MRNTVLCCILSFVFVFGFSACGSDTSNSLANANKSMVNSAEKAVNTAGNAYNSVANSISNAAKTLTANDDNGFMKDAAQGGMAEVDLGKLAATKSKDPEIRKFAQMMVTDHTAANNELKAVAAKKKFTLPTDIGSHKSTVDKLTGLSGADFDKAYVDAMVSGHQDVLAAFQKEADNGTEPDVKAFAAKTIPTIKKHLDAIKAIQAKMK